MQRFPSSNSASGGGQGAAGAVSSTSFMGPGGGGSPSAHQPFPSALIQRGQGQGQGGEEYGGGKPPTGYSWLEQQVCACRCGGKRALKVFLSTIEYTISPNHAGARTYGSHLSRGRARTPEGCHVVVYGRLHVL